MLTPKQQELLIFLQEALRQRGVCPSFEEMKTAVGLASKSGVHRLIEGLEERGYIRRLKNRARALDILKPLDIPAQNDNTQPTVPHALIAQAATTSIPLYGRIAAGLAIEALRQEGPDHLVTVPADMLGKDDHYALEVAGDSMMEAGILDGDIVIIKSTQTAHNGEIVVALIDDNDVTLKKWQADQGGRTITLVPCNKNHIAQNFQADRVRVQGKLVGLMRQY